MSRDGGIEFYIPNSWFGFLHQRLTKPYFNLPASQTWMMFVSHFKLLFSFLLSYYLPTQCLLRFLWHSLPTHLCQPHSSHQMPQAVHSRMHLSGGARPERRHMHSPGTVRLSAQRPQLSAGRRGGPARHLHQKVYLQTTWPPSGVPRAYLWASGDMQSCGWYLGLLSCVVRHYVGIWLLLCYHFQWGSL